MTYDVYLSLGSNINPKSHIIETIKILNTEFSLRSISHVYKTKPVKIAGNTEPFHNLAVLIHTSLESRNLKKSLRAIESVIGRDRTADKAVNPRVIDIDISVYDPPPKSFTLPDEVTEQAFVTYPLSDILDPQTFSDLPNTRTEWKEQTNSEIILNTIEYDWPKTVGKFTLDPN